MMFEENAVSMIVPLLYFVLLMTEHNLQARQFPDVISWNKTGVFFFGIVLVISVGLKYILPIDFMQKNSLFGESFSWFSGVFGALLTTSFVTYWFHRAEHHFNLLWRSFHQLHHSAVRVDVAGAFYTHPLEPLVKMTFGAIVAFWLFGLDMLSATIVTTVLGSISIFQHWNVSTPYWLGFIIPRPESHCLHHEYGIHGRNYADLPIWDIIFGTFLNPKSQPKFAVGFDADKAVKLTDMLLMRDVNAKPRDR